MTPKNKNDYEEIDNLYELIAYIIKKHWGKLLLIILIAGLVITGFKVQCGKNSFEKTPIKLKPPAGQVINE